ncbi:MAG: CbiX/SirB N-terminal domain-containing protein [Natronospirillum sp.]
MKALLLAAHGSRVDRSNEEFQVLAERVSKHLSGRYDVITTAFLELATPTIGDEIDRLVAAGAERIRILPCFLLEGSHVGEDIPALVATARDKHPGVKMELQPHLAADPQFVNYLAQVAATGQHSG